MKNKQKIKQAKKNRRIRRVRAKIKGRADKPRLAVFRSLKYISAQLIDDDHGKTLLFVSDQLIPKSFQGNKTKKAKEVGKILAKKALAQGIERVVFDRRGYKFHGRIKALAEGTREGGIIF